MGLTDPRKGCRPAVFTVRGAGIPRITLIRVARQLGVSRSSTPARRVWRITMLKDADRDDQPAGASNGWSTGTGREVHGLASTRLHQGRPRLRPVSAAIAVPADGSTSGPSASRASRIRPGRVRRGLRASLLKGTPRTSCSCSALRCWPSGAGSPSSRSPPRACGSPLPSSPTPACSG
jgi:hypothetical protein